MTYTVSVRELRNHTAEVLRRVEAGETATLTANGRPVAEIQPCRSRPSSVPARAAFERIRRHQADPELRADLDQLFPADEDALDRVARRYRKA